MAVMFSSIGHHDGANNDIVSQLRALIHTHAHKYVSNLRFISFIKLIVLLQIVARREV